MPCKSKGAVSWGFGIISKVQKSSWTAETVNLWSSFVINTTLVYQNTKQLISVSCSQLIGSQGIALKKY